jgi:hypothetical protein
MARDYKKETAWEDSPRQVKRREARNRARNRAEKEGRVHKGDGKEVDHIKMNPGGLLNNSSSNTRVISRGANRKKQPKHKGIW